MKLKITTDNAAKIEAALAEVNGKATAFTVATYHAVAVYAEAIEKRLDASRLPKAERNGVTATIRPAGPTANAYKYAAKSTTVTLQRGAKDWYLTAVTDASVYPRERERVTIKISEAQRDAISRKALEDFTVTTPHQPQ